MSGLLLSASHILLTGATGLIGRELIPLLLRQTPSTLWALVRPRNGTDCESRLAERRQRSGCRTVVDDPEVLSAVTGDMTEPDLGLSRTDCDRITRHVDLISAGVEDATPLGESGCFVDEYYGRREPLRLIPPAQWSRDVHRQYVRTPAQRRVFSALRHYLPFLNMNVVYDNGRLRRALAPRPLVIEPFSSYATGLLELMSPQLLTGC